MTKAAENKTAVFDGKAFVRSLTSAPGVYRMLAADGNVLYIGKAAALNKRVASYFNKNLPSQRIASMVLQIAAIEVTVTRTEAEALILENQLIKSLRPRYNVLLRDDKSYPQLLISDETWPRLSYHRGPRSSPGRYFGPYPSAVAVRDTLERMFKLFRLRSCEDSVFRNRSRPCLQHQIGRCSAPCVGLITPRDYDASVRRAVLFLEGRSNELVEELTQTMEAASIRLDFEQAALLRDQIAGIRHIQSKQYVEGEQADIDVLACCLEQGRACVFLMALRAGLNQGTRAFFPRTNGVEDEEDVLNAFVGQYYLEHAPPREVVLSHPIADAELLQAVLGERAGRKVELKWAVRGDRARYLEMARNNAGLALSSEISSSTSQRARVEALQHLLGLEAAPKRIECFDISHTQGEATVASCVVFDAEGPRRSQYRRFNITDITPGDDYAAMQQALLRRFTRALKEGVQPDVLLIDGGEGQLAQARGVLDTLGMAQIALLGVAKGRERRAGHETLILPDGRCIQPGAGSAALQLVQQVRDEAHRFAITGHRGKRQKTRETSQLEDIPGIGSSRRAKLLRHFGGLSGLRAAGVEEIARVDSISTALAQRIYASLHGLAEGGGGLSMTHEKDSL